MKKLLLIIPVIFLVGCSPTSFEPAEVSYAQANYQFFQVAAPDIKRRIKEDPTATGAFRDAQLGVINDMWYLNWKRYQEVVLGAKPPYTSRDQWVPPDEVSAPAPGPVPGPTPAEVVPVTP